MADYILDVLKETSKLDWAFPFQRTGAFPLDRSSLFSSYEDAELYAKGGADERGLSGSSYIGQTIAVYDAVENKVVLYLIQPNRSLLEVGSGSNAEEFEILTQNIETLKTSLNNVYTKDQTNTAIAAAVANSAHLSRKIVESYDDIDVTADDAHLYIYMVPNGFQENDDKYDEYVVIDGVIEKVGSWEVDLRNYATKDEVAKKVDSDENSRLMTLVEGDKLSRIEEGAQVNIIDSISEDFSIDDNKKLTLNTLSINKITNLQTLLNNKVDQQEGYTLLSPDDQKKLAALVVGDNNNLEISGKINAENVQGLADWLNKNAATIKGLSENNLTNDLYTKLDESLFISSIDTSQLNVSNGKLSIIAVDRTKITGLEDALNAKAEQTQVDNLSISINNISSSLNNYVTKEAYNKDIAEIRNILTWKEMN